MGKVVASEGMLEERDLKQAQTRGRRSSRVQRRFLTKVLVATDVAMFAIGLLIARWFSHHLFDVPGGQFFHASRLALGLILIAYLTVYWAYGLYNSSQLSSGGSDYRAVGNANAVAFVAAILIAGFRVGWGLDARSLVPFWFWITFATIAGRFLARRFIFAERRHGRPVERTLIMGANSEGIAIAEQLVTSERSGSKVIAFLDDLRPNGDQPVPGVPVIGRMEELEAAIESESIDSILITSPKFLTEFFAREDRSIEILSHVEVQMAWGGFELLTTGVRVKEEGNVPLVVLNKTRIRGLHFVLKTVLDYLISIVALILLFPLFLVLYVAIKKDSKGPVIHKRGVVGVNGKKFYAYKFRTMYVDAEALMTPELKEEWRVHGKIKDDPRITRMGRFLRKYSLDELPQLINVIRGEMSLVGPRMITQAELQRFGRWQHSRNLVKPGLTGLWQISGRSDLSYEERARLDIYYIRNHTIWLDLRILVKTIPAVLTGRGAS